jgi:hypothetical protein
MLWRRADRSHVLASHHIGLFTFTLSGTASIGPQALRALWAKASK